MAYAPNYYNYQVAVIFAIMLGGMLLLALVLGAIYFICVVNLRNRKASSVARTYSGRSSGARWRAMPQQYHYPPPITVMGQQPLPPQQQQFQQQSGEYTPRAPASPYTTALQQQYQVEPQQPQMVAPRIREMQPEFAYQQGPTTWTTTSPLREDRMGYSTGGGMPGSPPGVASTSVGPAGYHMSSV